MQYEHHMVLDLLKQGHPNADQKVGSLTVAAWQAECRL